MVQTPDRTYEDKLVTKVLDELPSLVELGSCPELDLLVGGDVDLIDEYGNDLKHTGFVPLDEFGDTDWGASVDSIINWGEDNGFAVSVDSELRVNRLPTDGRVVVNIAACQYAAPIWMNVVCDVSGRVDLKVRVQPTGIDNVHTVFDGPIVDVDVEEVRQDVNQYKPFVTGRVSELIEEADVNASQARAISLREVGLTHDEVSERLGITKGASSSYQWKFNNSVQESEHLFITRSPVPRRVLAKHTFTTSTYETERWYVCEEIMPTTDEPITVTGVRGDVIGDAGVNLDMTTSSFSSLRECIREYYTNSDLTDLERAQEVRDLFDSLPQERLADAGFDALPPAREVIDSNVP